MILFSEETPHQAREGVESLVQEVWDEIGHGTLHSRRPNPNYETYYKLHAVNVLHVLTARKNGVIIGYCTPIIIDLMQFKGIKGCFVDSIYLKKAYRTINGYKFLKFIQETAKKHGATRMRWDVTVINDFGRTLERMGYQLESHSYGGEL